MSAISFRELTSRVEKGLPDSAYLFSGRDRDRKVAALSAIETALKDSSQGALAVHRIRADETSPEDLSAHLLNIPLFEKKRLIVIPDVERTDRGSRDVLLEFVQSPSGEVYLVATTDLSQREISRKGTRFLKGLQKHCTGVDFSPPRGGELKRRANALARELGFRITEEALAKLLTMTGKDVEVVRQEMEKLSLFLPPGGEAGPEEVDAVVRRGGEVDVWELADAIVGRELPRAQQILRDLLSRGEKPVQIIGALWYQVLRLAWCRSLIDLGLEDKEIGGRMNLRGWLLRNTLSKAVRFTAEEYNGILNLLFELDIAVRSRGRGIEPLFSRSLAEMGTDSARRTAR